MTRAIVFVAFSALVLAASFLPAIGSRARSPIPSGRQQSAPASSDVHDPAALLLAYHTAPPTERLPKTVDPSEFRDRKGAFVAYSLAAEIPALLYQEPCYCGCARRDNHASLLDCFTSKHGSLCPACQKEVMFIYTRSRANHTAAEIRAAMASGEVWKFDIYPFIQDFYARQKESAPAQASPKSR